MSQAAEQATIDSGNSAASTVITESANNTLELKLDGKTATVTLTSGTYTDRSLPIIWKQQSTASDALAGQSVSGRTGRFALQMTSDRYGTASDLRLSLEQQ